MIVYRDGHNKNRWHRWYQCYYTPPGRCLNPADDPVLVAKIQDRLDKLFRPELRKPVTAPWYTRLWKRVKKYTSWL